MLPEMSLEGRVTIVTGASRGIGREVALVMAEAGSHIVVAARTESDLDVTARKVRALGREALAVPTDICRASEVDILIEKAMQRFGKVDVMVNNAGKLLRLASAPLPNHDVTGFKPSRDTASRTTDEEWQSIIDTNLNGVFYCCRAVVPHMMEQGYGKIINISSTNSTMAFPLMAAYSCSKAAVNMLTRVLALEWAPYNICVNAIGPGDYDTDMTHESWEDAEGRQQHLVGIPLHREGKLRDLGLLAVYLASPASDYVTGQIVYIDGGMTAA